MISKERRQSTRKTFLCQLFLEAPYYHPSLPECDKMLGSHSNPKKQKIEVKKTMSSYFILKSWQPLAITWILMALEGPLVSAMLTRGPEPEYHLAAFAISFSIALLLESPIIMMMSVSLSLVKGKNSYEKLRKFSHSIAFGLTCLMLFLLWPSNYKVFSNTFLDLDEKLIHLIHITLFTYLPWPGFIGYRRFHQGLLIADRQNKMISLGTFLRFFAFITSFLLLSHYKWIEGAPLAGLCINFGIVLEALFIRFFARNTLEKIKNKKDKPLFLKDILAFYYPLALTTLVGLSTQPITSYAAIHAASSLNSLAVLPFLNSFMFFFRALCLSFQEIILSLLGEQHENYEALRNFALKLGGGLSLIFFLLVFTPFNTFMVQKVFGFSSELSEFSLLPLKVMGLVPLLSVYICWRRSLFISLKKTLCSTYASFSEVFTISFTLFYLVNFTEISGALCIGIALFLGRASSSLCLTLLTYKPPREKLFIRKKGLSF